MILALSGGVGGAKLALGLYRIVPPAQLTIVANTGDDFEHLGLHVAPDLDTVVYTLAGLANRETGWGVAGERWEFLGAIERLGGPAWFRLGDRDLAMHVLRTARLRQGETLAGITADICSRLGIHCTIAPMSNDPVRTIVETDAGPLSFQDYFVRRKCEPVATGFTFVGADIARPDPRILAALANPDLRLVVFCPSNPYVSIGPMLAMCNFNQAIRQAAAPKVAVSPIVAGTALKGPAAKMMREMGMEVSALGIARQYRGLIDCLIVDESDAAWVPEIESLGMRALAVPTVMRDEQGSINLAEHIVRMAAHGI